MAPFFFPATQREACSREKASLVPRGISLVIRPGARDIRRSARAGTRMTGSISRSRGNCSRAEGKTFSLFAQPVGAVARYNRAADEAWMTTVRRLEAVAWLSVVSPFESRRESGVWISPAVASTYGRSAIIRKGNERSQPDMQRHEA